MPVVQSIEDAARFRALRIYGRTLLSESMSFEINYSSFVITVILYNIYVNFTGRGVFAGWSSSSRTRKQFPLRTEAVRRSPGHCPYPGQQGGAGP